MSQSIFNLTAKTRDNFLKYTSLFLETINKLFLYKGHVANLTDLRAIAKPLNGEIRVIQNTVDSGYETYRFIQGPEDGMKVYGFVSANDGTGFWGEANGYSIRVITLTQDTVIPAGTWFMYSSVRSLVGNFSSFQWGYFYLCRYEPGGVPTDYNMGSADYPTADDQMNFRAHKLDRKLFDRNGGSFVNPIFIDRLGIQRPNNRMFMYDDGSMLMRKSLRVRADDTTTEAAALRFETTSGGLLSTWERTGDLNRLYSPDLDLQLRSKRVRINNDSGNAPLQGSVLKSIDDLGSTEWVHPTEEPPASVASTKGTLLGILGYNRQNSYFDVHYAAVKIHMNLGLLHSKIPYGMYSTELSVYSYNFANEMTIKSTGYMYSSPVDFATVISKSEINMEQPTPREAHFLHPSLYHAMNSDGTDWAPVIRVVGVNNSSYRDSTGTLTLRGNAGSGTIDPNDSKMLQICTDSDLTLESFDTPAPLLYGNRTSLVAQSELSQETTNTSSDPFNMLIGGTDYFALEKDKGAKWVWEILDGEFDFKSIGFCVAISGQTATLPHTEMDTLIAGIDIHVSVNGIDWTLAASVTNHNPWDDIAINGQGNFIKFTTMGSTSHAIYIRHCSITGDYL